MAKIANVALTNTFDTWRVRSNEAFDRLSQFAIDNSKLYANTLTANVRFVSAGSTRLGTTGSNRTIVNGLLSGNGNLNVAGNTTISGILNVNGGINLGDNGFDLLTVSGRATIGTNLSVSGNLAVTGISTFTGASSFNGAVNLGNDSFDLTTIAGRATVGTNLTVSGNAAVSGISTFTGAANFNGAVTLGDAATDLTTINGRVTIAQNLNVSGNTTIGAANKVANATGWFGVNGRATVSTNLFVAGNTTINGTTTDNSNALNQTLTDGATINWNTALGRVATVTLGGNRSIAAPTNLKVGTYILHVIQDVSGNRTLTWNSAFKWTAGVAPPLSTTGSARDVFSFVSDGTNLYGSFLPDVR